MGRPQKNCGAEDSVANPISDLEFSSTKNHRHPKSLKSSSYREKEIKVVRSVAKELSGKSFQAELSKFQPQNGLLERRVICQADQVKVKFSSPLNGISSPFYVKKWKCEGMTSEEDDTLSNSTSVVAVKLNWRKGVKVQQNSKYSRQTTFVEPGMTTTDFDFESKLKFQKHLQSQIPELFPNGDVKILDGNECHGRTTIKSKHVQPEGYNPSSSSDDHSYVQIYDDNDEHKILLVPFHSKSGFDTDISKSYSFPYHAKFIINNKNFEHQFQLRFLPSQSPQHFGLIFTFANPDGSGFITVKSLLSVYSLFPSTPKHAYLVTYANNEDDNHNAKYDGRRGFRGQFVKNVKDTVSANLMDEKLVNGSSFGSWDGNNEFSIGSTLAHPHQRSLGIKLNNYSERPSSKHKEKVNLIQSIRADARTATNSVL